MEKDEKKSFVMYDSFLEAAERLDADAFKECILKLRDFALKGIDVQSDNFDVNLILIMAKPSLTKAKERYADAKAKGEKGREHG